MKLIIDIPEETVTAIQNGQDYRYDIHTTIAQGKPYEMPKGDLISREALKKAFAEYGEKAKFTQGSCQQLIDNAPTVKFSLMPADETKEDAYKRGYEKGKIAGILKANTRLQETSCVLTMFGKCSYNETGCSDCEIKDKIRKALSERPQGEWIVIDYDKKLYMHSCANLVFEYPYNFCPNCGADMKIKNINLDSGIREFDKKFADLIVFNDQPQRQLKSSDVHEDI